MIKWHFVSISRDLKVLCKAFVFMEIVFGDWTSACEMLWIYLTFFFLCWRKWFLKAEKIRIRYLRDLRGKRLLSYHLCWCFSGYWLIYGILSSYSVTDKAFGPDALLCVNNGCWTANIGRRILWHHSGVSRLPFRVLQHFELFCFTFLASQTQFAG